MKAMVGVLVSIAVFCACVQGALGQSADFRWWQHGDAGAYSVSADGSVIFGEATAKTRTSPNSVFLSDAAFVWREDAPIRFLPKRTVQSCWANGVSGDGRVFVGSLNDQAYRWTLGADEVELLLPPKSGTSSATAASYDGRTIVGTFREKSGGRRGFRWSRENGITLVAGPRGHGETLVNDVSSDGTVVVGSYRDTDGKLLPFRWSQERGAEALGHVGKYWRLRSYALGVSADGRVVVGVETYGASSSQAWYWTRSTGIRLLSNDGYPISQALATNHDGSVIVGTLGGRAAVWLNGDPITLRPLLHDAGVDVTNFPLHHASDCSRSGRIVVGGGDPNIAFRAVLPLPNHAPIAVAGKNANVGADDESGAWVELDGGASFDQDEDELRFRWTASDVRFDDREGRATLAFFPVGTTDVTMVVKDEGDLEDSDTIRVTVRRADANDEEESFLE